MNDNSRTGFVEETDPFKLQDKHGNTILCFCCGKSALDDKSIISCDYCNLSLPLGLLRSSHVHHTNFSTKVDVSKSYR